MDMADKHQSEWLNHLPFVLLGRKVALQPDLQASSSELTFGQNLRIPGQILHDPGEAPTNEELESLLKSVRESTTIIPSQTSSHTIEKELPELPPNITHVYTRQHKAVGLQTPYEGPFRVESRPSRSTVKIEVGIYKSGEKRFEIRHLNDVKIAHPESMAAPAQRSKLGRPSKSTEAKTVSGPGRLPPSSSAGNTNRLSDSLDPEPSQFFSPVAPTENKQVGTPGPSAHATSTSSDRSSALTANEEFEGTITGPPPQPAFSRPIRTTRNPTPYYVDGFSYVFG